MASHQLPSTMKAVLIPAQGGIEVVKVSSGVELKPRDGEVVMKTEWAGVNFIDTYQRGGLYPIAGPFILGNECAGTVVQIGKGIDRSTISYKEGDKVAAMASLSSFAEYARATPPKISKLPENVSTKIGAALILQGLTALTLAREAHFVEKGQFVLVHAIAGGMGLLLAQICSHFGAIVIGTTSTAAKAELGKANGASYVFNYRDLSQEEITKEIKKITGGEGNDAGVHVVFDGVGKDTFDMDLEVLRRKGSLVTYGNASGAVPPVSPLKLTAKNLKLSRPTFMNYVSTQEEWDKYSDQLWDLVAKGVVKVHLHKEEGYEFTTDGVRQTQTDITSGKTTGKLLIKIA